MSEEMVTMPEEITDQEESIEEESQDVSQPQETESKDSEKQTEQKNQFVIVEELKKTGQIPKGVEPFVDDNGELKFVIPINGKKYIANFKQVLSGYNINQAGEQKLKQGKELENKFNSILNNIAASNPEGKKELKKFLSKLGYDLGELSESFLSEVIEERSLSEEERAMKKRIAELEEKEAKLKKLEEEQEMTKEQKAVFDKQQKFSEEIVGAMKARKLDDVDPELKKTLMTSIIKEMIEARKADYDLNADEALDNVLSQYDLLLENLGKLYSKEHLKQRLPKSFRELVLKMSLDNEVPPVSSSIQPGKLEVGEDVLDKIKNKKQEQKKKKLLLSEW